MMMKMKSLFILLACLFGLTLSAVAPIADPPIYPPSSLGKKGTLMGLFLGDDRKTSIDVANPFGGHERWREIEDGTAVVPSVSVAAYEAGKMYVVRRVSGNTQQMRIEEYDTRDPTASVRSCTIDQTIVGLRVAEGETASPDVSAVLVALTYNPLDIQGGDAVMWPAVVRIEVDPSKSTCQHVLLYRFKYTGSPASDLFSAANAPALNAGGFTADHFLPIPGMFVYDSKVKAVAFFVREAKTAGSNPVRLFVIDAKKDGSRPSTLMYYDKFEDADGEITPTNLEFADDAYVVTYVKRQKDFTTTHVSKWVFTPSGTTNPGTLQQVNTFVELTTSQVPIGVSAGGNLDGSEEMFVTVRSDVPPGAVPETQALTRPALIDVDATAPGFMGRYIGASSQFKGVPLQLWVSKHVESATDPDGCVGFSGALNQYPHFNVTDLRATLLARCRWVGVAPSTFQGTTTLVQAGTDRSRAYCELPELPDEPRASKLKVALSNDGYHFGNEREFPIFDPKLNISDQLMRTVDNYFTVDLGISSALSVELSSTSPGAAFTKTSLSWSSSDRTINAGAVRFSQLGSNTIVGKVTSCPSGSAPLSDIKFEIQVQVKEFVGSDLPATLVNNQPPRAVTVYLGSADPAKRVRYNVTLVPSVTTGSGTVSSDPLVFNYEHTKSFTVVGTGIGPLGISLIPSGPNANQFAVAQLTTEVVSLNITLEPENILLNEETTVTVTLNRDSSVRLDIAMDGTGTVSNSILFKESSVSSFKIKSTEYGLIKVTFTPNNDNPLESPDFAQFTVVQKEILCAEVVNATTLTPRLPRPVPAEVVVSTSSTMSVEFEVQILEGTASVGGLSASNRVVLSNANQTTFAFTKLTPGVLKYRLVAVAGDILIGAGSSPRFAPSDFEIVVNAAKLSLDLADAIVQNEKQSVIASIDLRSNVTYQIAVAAAGGPALASEVEISKRNLTYPNVDTDRFDLMMPSFGTITLTFTVSGPDAPDFLSTQVFSTVVRGSVRSSLPAQVFAGSSLSVSFTLSGNATVNFALSASAGVVVGALAGNSVVESNSRPGVLSFLPSPNATLVDATTRAPVLTANITFTAMGLASITLTPVDGADSAHFGVIVFTANVVPNPEVACAAGMVTCPDGVSCRVAAQDCPTPSLCPINRPFRCALAGTSTSTSTSTSEGWGLCVAREEDCSGAAGQLPECPNGGVRCPGDLSCAATVHDCPTSVTCPASLPVKCYDGSCRATLSDCALAPNCAAGLFECPSGECASSSTECSKGQVCEQGKTLCSDLVCRDSADLCPDSLAQAICPPSLPVRCADGTCIKSSGTCADPVCPASTPTRCETGECASSASGCASSANGCPAGLAEKCPDGTCVAATSQCPSSVPKCPTTRPSLCPDGSCAASQADCPASSGCPADAPVLCADGVNCVNLAVQSCPAAEVCDPRAPVRCPGGLCATSESLCPVGKSLPRCDGDKPVACDEGSCVSSSSECRTIKACPEDRSHRCADGSCRASEDRCPLTEQGVCKTTGYAVQCPRGECAASLADCTVPGPDSGCPASSPVKCDGGSCATTASQCALLSASALGRPGDSGSSSSNGCPAVTPFRCPNGECVSEAASASCKAIGGCPLSVPVRCGDGSCAVDKATCATRGDTCPGSTPIRCPDGSCETSTANCRTAEGCALDTPHRCSDGSCRALLVGPPSPNVCPSAATCVANPTTPFMCDDGSCAESAGKCKPVIPCPANAPVRCPGSLECKPSASQCEAFRCPLGQPVFCIDSGMCATTADMCPTPSCPDETPFRCAWGTCVASYAQCTEMVDCKGSGSGESSLGFKCPDGSCRPRVEECPKLMACPWTAPHRCDDGTCATSGNACVARRRKAVARRFKELAEASAAPRTTGDLKTASGGGARASSLSSSSSSSSSDPESSLSRLESAGRGALAHLAVGGDCAAEEVRCADGTCAADSKLCVPYFGCSSPTPYMCPTGLCVADPTACSDSCAAGEYRCRDNTCKRVASECPEHRIPQFSGIIVTHLVGKSARHEILSESGVEAYVSVPAGAVNAKERVVTLAMIRRTRSELAGAPWDPDANLVTSVFDINSYTADALTFTPQAYHSLSAPVEFGWSAAQRLISASADLCLAAMSSDLLQLSEPGCVDKVAVRSGDSIYGSTTSLSPHGVVRDSAKFGAITDGAAIVPTGTDGSSGLTSGGIVGIVFAVLLLLLLLLLLVLYFIRKRKAKEAELRAAAADKAAKQAALVEIAEDNALSIKDQKGFFAAGPTRAQKAALAAKATGAPLSVPVLAPKQKVKTLDTLPPLVTKRPPQTVVPYRPALPTLFASEDGKGPAPLVETRKAKEVDLATLHRTTTEGLQRSGAEDERPAFHTRPGISRMDTTGGMLASSTAKLHGSMGHPIHGSTGSSSSAQEALSRRFGGPGSPRNGPPATPASARKGRLFADVVAKSSPNEPLKMPELPEKPPRGGSTMATADGGMEDVPPPQFGGTPVKVEDREEERLPNHVVDEPEVPGEKKGFAGVMP